jgi:hypothetical protein
VKNGHVAGVSGELLELCALLDHLRDEVAVALHAVGVNAFGKLAEEPRDDPNRVCGDLRGAPAPHKDISDLYEKMSGKRESASEAHD